MKLTYTEGCMAYNLDIDGSLYKISKRLFEETYPYDNYDDYTQKGFSDK